jgi:hypothetical protein
MVLWHLRSIVLIINYTCIKDKLESGVIYSCEEHYNFPKYLFYDFPEEKNYTFSILRMSLTIKNHRLRLVSPKIVCLEKLFSLSCSYSTSG